MSGENNESQTQESEEQNNEGSQPSQAPTGANLEETGFKWGSEAPEDWRGKDAAYAVNKYQELVGAVQGYLQQQNANLSQAQTQQMTQNVQRNIDPELWLTEPAAAEAQLRQSIRQEYLTTLGQAAQPLLANSTEMAKRLAKDDPDVKEVWNKYGSEIETLGNAVDPTIRGNPAFWQQAAQLVKSRHLDEFAQAKAEKLVAEMRATASNGQGSAPGAFSREHTTAMEKIKETDYGKSLIDKYGEHEVAKQVDLMGYSVDEFAKICADTKVIRNPNNAGEWWNKDLVKTQNARRGMRLHG